MIVRASLLPRLAWSAAGATLALVVLGGVVRITGSGMGCGDDWPLCRGRLLPPLELRAVVEYAHRLAASLVGVLVLALAVLARTAPGRRVGLPGPAALAAALLLLQVALGALAVKLALAPWMVVAHLVTGMALVGALTDAALRAGEGRRAGGRAPAGRAARAELPLVRICAALAFAVIALGGLVANLHAGLACRGFPLCNGSVLPQGGAPVVIHWLHRVAALALVLLVLLLWLRLRRVDVLPGRVRRLAMASLGLTLLQVAVAGAMVLTALPGGLRAAHVALGASLWVVLVALHHEAGGRGERRAAAQPALGAIDAQGIAFEPRAVSRAGAR